MQQEKDADSIRILNRLCRMRGCRSPNRRVSSVVVVYNRTKHARFCSRACCTSTMSRRCGVERPRLLGDIGLAARTTNCKERDRVRRRSLTVEYEHPEFPVATRWLLAAAAKRESSGFVGPGEQRKQGTSFSEPPNNWLCFRAGVFERDKSGAAACIRRIHHRLSGLENVVMGLSGLSSMIILPPPLPPSLRSKPIGRPCPNPAPA